MADDVSSPPPAHWRLWATLLWGAAIAIVFVVLQTAVVFTGVEFDVNAGEAQVDEQIAALAQNGYVLSLATFVTTVVGCVLIAGVVKLKKGSR